LLTSPVGIVDSSFHVFAPRTPSVTRFHTRVVHSTFSGRYSIQSPAYMASKGEVSALPHTMPLRRQGQLCPLRKKVPLFAKIEY
jgi:hypothetical protein